MALPKKTWIIIFLFEKFLGLFKKSLLGEIFLKQIGKSFNPRWAWLI